MAGERGGLTGIRDFEIMSAVTQLVRFCCSALGARPELGARELGVSAARFPAETRIASCTLDPAIADWPNSAALLRKMMMALGVEPDAPAVTDHAVLEELRQMCGACAHKTECARDLAAGTAADNFYAYCPNARALDSIYVEMTFNRL